MGSHQLSEQSLPVPLMFPLLAQDPSGCGCFTPLLPLVSWSGPLSGLLALYTFKIAPEGTAAVPYFQPSALGDLKNDFLLYIVSVGLFPVWVPFLGVLVAALAAPEFQCILHPRIKILWGSPFL